jgi:integrase
MRPGEVCGMRICHIDMTDPNLWCYRPPHHKTSHHGHERIVFLGKRAQAIIQPFLKPDLTAFVFSPADAERERREQQHARRKTPLSCGNVPGSNRSPTPRKQPGERYTVESYGRAIKNACERAFPMPVDLVEPTGAAAIAKDTPTAKASRAKARREWRARYGWHPHRLRHNFGTWARKEYSLEVAQLLLGQSTIKAAEIYAEKNVAAAQRIMAAVG